MSKLYDAIVYIGRFQPFHNAHQEVLEKAIKIADKVIVIIGSADQPRDFKNPFTFDERRTMVFDGVFDANRSANWDSLIICPNVDTVYDDDAWVLRVQKIVEEHTKPNDRIAIVGAKKDAETERYLAMFPQWEYHGLPLMEILSATDIRDLYFQEGFNQGFIAGVVPRSTLQFLNKFRFTQEYTDIIESREFHKKYRKPYENLPYPPVFLTTDAVVTQAGHVLLVRRRALPGRGLWALPGGFFDAEGDRDVTSAMLRELKEETKIDLPIKILKGSIKEQKIFDAKERSARGRTVTVAFHVSLTDGEWNLPKVKGSDDAEKARWFPLNEVKREIMFEDHFDIISHFVKLA